MAIKVIDVSVFQGNIDFSRVKADGIKGVIIRCGYTGYGVAKRKREDARFSANYAAAKAAGLPVGVYYYSCAVTEKEAREEATFTLSLLRGKTLEYPVYWDTEDNHDTTRYAPQSQLSIGKAALTLVGEAFLKTISDAGFTAGIYASTSWLNNQLNMSRLKAWQVWVAQYASAVTYKGDYQMWQYTSTGRVDGIGGAVDLNRCYVDYPAIISGTTKEERTTEKFEKGENSIGVLALKMLLLLAKEAGIITQNVDINGIFGDGTLTAVKQLQKAAGLAQTGQADEALIKAARSLIASDIRKKSSVISAVKEAIK